MAVTPNALTNADLVIAPRTAQSHWIDDWRPEDPLFCEQTGRRVARRNLVFSILSEHIGFSVWSLWSVFVLFLGPAYGLDPSRKFLLTTVPTAVGAASHPLHVCSGEVRRAQLDDPVGSVGAKGCLVVRR